MSVWPQSKPNIMFYSFITIVSLAKLDVSYEFHQVIMLPMNQNAIADVGKIWQEVVSKGCPNMARKKYN